MMSDTFNHGLDAYESGEAGEQVGYERRRRNYGLPWRCADCARPHPYWHSWCVCNKKKRTMKNHKQAGE